MGTTSSALPAAIATHPRVLQNHGYITQADDLYSVTRFRGMVALDGYAPVSRWTGEVYRPPVACTRRLRGSQTVSPRGFDAALFDDIQVSRRSRNTDPETSHAAARRAKHFAESHAGRILLALQLHGRHLHAGWTTDRPDAGAD